MKSGHSQVQFSFLITDWFKNLEENMTVANTLKTECVFINSSTFRPFIFNSFIKWSLTLCLTETSLFNKQKPWQKTTSDQNGAQSKLIIYNTILAPKTQGSLWKRGWEDFKGPKQGVCCESVPSGNAREEIPMISHQHGWQSMT